jgi:Lon protease-like protein
MVDALSGQDLERLPIFPLPEAALFPGVLLPLHVFEPRYRALVKDALAARGILAVARLKPGFESDYAGRPPVFEVCGAGVIVDHLAHPDGRYHITLRGLSRVRILEELSYELSYRLVRGELLFDAPADRALSAALETKISSLWTTLAPKLPEALRDLTVVTRGADGAGRYSDLLAGAIVGDADTSQSLLSELDPCERLRTLAERLQTLADALAPPHAGRKRDWN